MLPPFARARLAGFMRWILPGLIVLMMSSGLQAAGVTMAGNAANVQGQAVPEPSTWVAATFSLGVIVFAVLRRLPPRHR